MNKRFYIVITFIIIIFLSVLLVLFHNLKQEDTNNNDNEVALEDMLEGAPITDINDIGKAMSENLEQAKKDYGAIIVSGRIIKIEKDYITISNDNNVFINAYFSKKETKQVRKNQTIKIVGIIDKMYNKKDNSIITNHIDIINSYIY